MEDIQEEDLHQEDQQARSSVIRQGNDGSSGGQATSNLFIENSIGQNEKKSQFLPQLITYEEISKKSMKKNVNSTKNLSKRSKMGTGMGVHLDTEH